MIIAKVTNPGVWMTLFVVLAAIVIVLITGIVEYYDRRKVVGVLPDLWLNANCDKVCKIHGDTIEVEGIGNQLEMVVDGFPVDPHPNIDGTYYLYEEVFNEVPNGWTDPSSYREYETEKLTPWLESMGFTDINWRMGEQDSFGPLSRMAYMRLNDHTFIYIYG